MDTTVESPPRGGLYALAILLSVLNFGGLIMALAEGEAGHAAAHVAIGVGLLLWGRRFRGRPGRAQRARLEGLEDEVDELRRELSDAQDRLDFTERMLTRQRADQPAPARTPR